MSTVDGTRLTARTPEEVGALVQELQRQAATKRDYIAEGEQLRYIHDPEHGVQVTMAQQASVDSPMFVPPVRFDIGRVAHDQVAEKMGIPRAYYQRMLTDAGPLLANNVNHWLEADPRKRYMIRTLDGHMRAVLSDRFRVLDNSDLFFNSFEVIEKVGAEITRADLTDKRFYLRAIHPEWRERMPALTKRAGFHEGSTSPPDADVVVPGVVISNSEVGHGGLQAEQFMLILICKNGMIGESKLRQVHVGRKQEELGWMSTEAVTADDKAFWLKVRDLVAATFDRDAFRRSLVALNNTDAVPLDRPLEAVDNVVQAYDLTDADKQAVINKLMAGRSGTAFDLIQAVTSRANDIEDYDEAARLQRVGTDMVGKVEQLVRVRQ